MSELKPCPFCGGKARLSFKDVEFGGKNFRGDRKVRYRFQVICNKCYSRGKPVKTDFLINPKPWSSLWASRPLSATDVVIERTEALRPWAEQAIDAWNRRVVEVVYGEWITDDKGVTYCGNCRHIDDYASVHNYCPNCGAKMDGEHK